MIELASALTLPIAKLLLKSWLGDTGADIGVGLLQLGLKRLGDRSKARTAQHRAEEIADAVIADLERFFANEHVAKEKLAVAALALGDTIERHVDAAFLISQRLNAEEIKRALLDARPVDKIYKRAEPEHGLYVRLVDALAPRLRAVAPELPGYGLERDSILLQKLDEVAAAAPRLLEALREIHGKLDELRERPARLARGFERHYLDAVVKELDYVEILGIEELDSKSRRADLTVAYLSLTARLGEGEEQQKIDFAAVLTLLPLFGNRLWVEGGAGSGKSTLVRWAALEAARWRLGQAGSRDILDIAPDLDSWLNFLRPEEADGRTTDIGAAQIRAPSPDREHRLRPVGREHPDKAALRAETWRARPFIAFLRFATEGVTLDQLPSLAVRTIGTPPGGWLQEAFSNRGADTFLIFDGVDEVPVGRKREQILEQIGDFAERFPDAQILVTSRPGAVEDGALDGFQKVVLEDLSEQQRLGFIDHWHQALATNFKRKSDDVAIAQLHRATLGELERQPSLALLATNPLLCAAICALHWLSRRKVVEDAWQRGTLSPDSMQSGVLPASLWNLCEALTRMLVHKRDLDQHLSSAAFGPAYRLSYELKREILARIAYGMVAGDLLSAMTRADARNHVTAALAGFRDQVPASAEDVLRALLERSGVLRGSGADAVEFVHNTVKAFLAAKFYVGLLTHDEVVRRIAAGSAEELASGLDEIAVFAAASPDHPDYARRLIEALLSDGPLRRLSTLLTSSKERRKLQLLALRCEAVASNLPGDIRDRVRAVAPRLFPPRDSQEARQLAALRDSAVVHLAYRSDAEASSSAAAVRCLRLIGTPAAQDTARQYMATESLVVAEELIDDHNPLEITAVLKAAQDFTTWEKVPPTIQAAIGDLSPLANLTNLHSLSLNGTQVADAAPLAKLTNLQWLDLSGTQIADAAPLAKLTGLQSLNLSGTQIRDAAPFANLTNLHSLFLAGTQIADAAPLAKLTGLQSLNLARTQVADAAPLDKFTNLQWLNLSGTQIRDAAPLANLTNLQSLDLSGTQVADAAPLANLTNLQSLNLYGTQVADAAPLANLTNLQSLDLSGTQVADAAPLANLINLQSLDLSGTQVADAAPLANLTNLHSLYLSGTQVADAAPLANLINLQWLNLARTQVADAAPLANLTNLQWLNLARTQVADAAPLAKLTNLPWLYLSGTQVADAAPLAKLTNLQWLDLAGAHVPQEQVTKLRRALAERGNHSVTIYGP